MIEAATPHDVPGWDQLAAAGTFYVAADWLRFTDTDRVARSRYLGLCVDDRLVAALSAHRAAREIDDGYIAARALGLSTEARSGGNGVVTLGGRRGFLSGVLTVSDTDQSGTADWLATLIRHAARDEREHVTEWWWPYLISSDATTVMAAGSRATGTAGPRVHLIGADCVIDVAGTSIDDHVAALPTRQRRTNFRREQTRFSDSGLEIRQVSLAEHWSRMGSLLAAVQWKYGHRQSADDLRSRLRRQGEHLAARAVTFACVGSNGIIGFSLAYRWGSELALRVVGFDYEHLQGAGEYAQLAVHAPLRYCYQHGLRRLHLGVGSYEAKCRRGARPRPLWAVTSFPDATAYPRTLAAEIAASLPAHESRSFTAQVEQSLRCWDAMGA